MYRLNRISEVPFRDAFPEVSFHNIPRSCNRLVIVNNQWHPNNIISHEFHVWLLVREPVIRSSPGWVTRHMNRQKLLRVLLFFLVISLLAASVSAALDRDTIPVSKDPLAENNPEIVSALKTHVAYVGQTQQARMDGVIAYIDRISGGNGTSNLHYIEEDYMATASSIPVMQTADEITEAREELRTQSQLFAEETKAQIVLFNGSTDDMRGSISNSVQSVDNSYSSMKDSLWLAKDTARITVFNQASQQRTALLNSLSKQGIDISLARNISQQIDTQRSAIQKALSDNSVSSLKTANSGLKALNRQFRGTVQVYRTDMQIQMKQAYVLAMNK
jgi:hypothetical protein